MARGQHAGADLEHGGERREALYSCVPASSGGQQTALTTEDPTWSEDGTALHLVVEKPHVRAVGEYV